MFDVILSCFPAFLMYGMKILMFGVCLSVMLNVMLFACGCGDVLNVCYLIDVCFFCSWMVCEESAIYVHTMIVMMTTMTSQ